LITTVSKKPIAKNRKIDMMTLQRMKYEGRGEGGEWREKWSASEVKVDVSRERERLL